MEIEVFTLGGWIISVGGVEEEGLKDEVTGRVRR